MFVEKPCKSSKLDLSDYVLEYIYIGFDWKGEKSKPKEINFDPDFKQWKSKLFWRSTILIRGRGIKHKSSSIFEI